MVPAKPWKMEAIMRLFLSVIVCYFGGSFLLAAAQHLSLHDPKGLRIFLLIGASLICLGLSLALLLSRASLRFEGGLARVAILLLLFYAGLTLGAVGSKMSGPIHPSVTQMIISALSLQGALLVLLPGFLRENDTSVTEAFGFRKRRLVSFLGGAAVACAFLPIARTLQAVSMVLMSRFHLHPEQQQVVQTLAADQGTAGRILFGLITVLIVPVAEEVFFRGILYAGIKQLGFPRLALWGAAIIFAAIHANLASFVPLTLLALALTILYERTGNLLAPISAHAVFNGLNLATLYLVEHALKT